MLFLDIVIAASLALIIGNITVYNTVPMQSPAKKNLSTLVHEKISPNIHITYGINNPEFDEIEKEFIDKHTKLFKARLNCKRHLYKEYVSDKNLNNELIAAKKSDDDCNERMMSLYGEKSPDMVLERFRHFRHIIDLIYRYSDKLSIHASTSYDFTFRFDISLRYGSSDFEHTEIAENREFKEKFNYIHYGKMPWNSLGKSTLVLLIEKYGNAMPPALAAKLLSLIGNLEINEFFVQKIKSSVTQDTTNLISYLKQNKNSPIIKQLLMDPKNYNALLIQQILIPYKKDLATHKEFLDENDVTDLEDFVYNDLDTLFGKSVDNIKKEWEAQMIVGAEKNNVHNINELKKSDDEKNSN